MSKIKVHQIYDGSALYLVRGTLDEKVALDAIMDEFEPEPEEDFDFDVEPRLVVERAGWFRCNPCSPLGDYGWLLGNASGPGRGNFIGIYADVAFDEVVYEIDLKELG